MTHTFKDEYITFQNLLTKGKEFFGIYPKDDSAGGDRLIVKDNHGQQLPYHSMQNHSVASALKVPVLCNLGCDIGKEKKLAAHGDRIDETKISAYGRPILVIKNAEVQTVPMPVRHKDVEIFEKVMEWKVEECASELSVPMSVPIRSYTEETPAVITLPPIISGHIIKQGYADKGWSDQDVVSSAGSAVSKPVSGSYISCGKEAEELFVSSTKERIKYTTPEPRNQVQPNDRKCASPGQHDVVVASPNGKQESEKLPPATEPAVEQPVAQTIEKGTMDKPKPIKERPVAPSTPPRSQDEARVVQKEEVKKVQVRGSPASASVETQTILKFPFENEKTGESSSVSTMTDDYEWVPPKEVASKSTEIDIEISHASQSQVGKAAHLELVSVATETEEKAMTDAATETDDTNTGVVIKRVESMYDGAQTSARDVVEIGVETDMPMSNVVQVTEPVLVRVAPGTDTSQQTEKVEVVHTAQQTITQQTTATGQQTTATGQTSMLMDDEPQAREIIAQPREIIPQPREIIPQPREIIPQPKEIIPQPREIIPQPKEIIPQPREIIPQPKEIIPQPREIIPQPREIIPHFRHRRDGGVRGTRHDQNGDDDKIPIQRRQVDGSSMLQRLLLAVGRDLWTGFNWACVRTDAFVQFVKDVRDGPESVLNLSLLIFFVVVLLIWFGFMWNMRQRHIQPHPRTTARGWCSSHRAVGLVCDIFQTLGWQQ